jgi:hypothetical protein
MCKICPVNPSTQRRRSKWRASRFFTPGRVNSISCRGSNLRHRLLPHLQKYVFHVTTRPAFELICKDGWLRHNQLGRYPTTYSQSENSFGRKNGYICLFDLRRLSNARLRETLQNYNFLNPFSDDQAVFLLFGSVIHPKMIPWTAGKNCSGVVLIPYAECWHSGDIELVHVCRVLDVSVRSQPCTNSQGTRSRRIVTVSELSRGNFS